MTDLPTEAALTQNKLLLLRTRPAEDKEQSRWRYSLMNWGHDPLKS